MQGRISGVAVEFQRRQAAWLCGRARTTNVDYWTGRRALWHAVRPETTWHYWSLLWMKWQLNGRDARVIEEKEPLI
jgi:hypothetical protein